MAAQIINCQRPNSTHKSSLSVQKATIKKYLTVWWDLISVKTEQVISTIKNYLMVRKQESGDAGA